MRKILDDYKDIIRIIIVLTIVLLIVTISHFFIRKYINDNNNDKLVLTLEDMIKNERYDEIDYTLIEDDIKRTIENIDNSRDESYGDNSYLIKYYESASGAIEVKLKEVENVIERRLDDEEKNQLYYSIEKFYTDLSSDEENIYRVYPSSVDAKLNIYKDRYEKLKEKCIQLASDYRAVLDK